MKTYKSLDPHPLTPVSWRQPDCTSAERTFSNDTTWVFVYFLPFATTPPPSALSHTHMQTHTHTHFLTLRCTHTHRVEVRVCLAGKAGEQPAERILSPLGSLIVVLFDRDGNNPSRFDQLRRASSELVLENPRELAICGSLSFPLTSFHLHPMVWMRKNCRLQFFCRLFGRIFHIVDWTWRQSYVEDSTSYIICCILIITVPRWQWRCKIYFIRKKNWK